MGEPQRCPMCRALKGHRHEPDCLGHAWYGAEPAVHLTPESVAPICRPSTASAAAGLLAAAAETMLERDGKYRGADAMLAACMQQFFPDGVALKSAVDHHRFHLFMLAVVKLTRYARNWSTGHGDSLTDGVNYLAMLQAIDRSLGAGEVRG